MSFDAVIVTVPHSAQRYPTVGDWLFGPGYDLHIRVSELGDWKMEACVAIHEMVEALLCRAHGIGQEAVDDFDFAFSGDEPGSEPDAPYHQEHMAAEKLEEQLAEMLGVGWNEYLECLKRVST